MLQNDSSVPALIKFPQTCTLVLQLYLQLDKSPTPPLSVLMTPLMTLVMNVLAVTINIVVGLAISDKQKQWAG